LPQDIQCSCISRAISTASGTLFGRATFFTPLSDALKLFFFFPMVAPRRAVVFVGVEVSVVADGRDDASHFQKSGMHGTRYH
jgi:hypothetical protein